MTDEVVQRCIEHIASLDRQPACGNVDADFLVLGHTNVPMAERVNGTLVVNPGSIGESREHGFKDLVSYAILDTSTDEVEFVKFPNPRLAGAMS